MEDNIMFKDNKVSARVATAWNERYKKEMSSEEYEKWKKDFNASTTVYKMNEKNILVYCNNYLK
jgi:hypothetical protein